MNSTCKRMKIFCLSSQAKCAALRWIGMTFQWRKLNLLIFAIANMASMSNNSMGGGSFMASIINRKVFSKKW